MSKKIIVLTKEDYNELIEIINFYLSIRCSQLDIREKMVIGNDMINKALRIKDTVLVHTATIED